MRVLICGSREWNDPAAIRRELEQLPAGSTILHGSARGADRLADGVARELGLEVLAYRPDWKLHGRGAGLQCNKRLLEEGRPELVLAFHPDIEHSKGTGDMVRRARAAGVRVRVIAG